MRRMVRFWSALGIAFALVGCSEGGVVGLESSVRFQPASIDLGIFYFGQPSETVLSVENLGGAGARLLFEELPADLSARPTELFLPARSADHVKLLFEPEEEGEIDSQIVVHEGGRTRLIPFRARVLEAPFSYPEVLDFGAVQMGISETRSLVLGNRLDVGLMLRLRGGRATTASRYTFNTAEIPLRPGEEVEIPITFRPIGESGRQDDLLFIECEGCPTKEVVLRGEGREVMLAFDPDPIAFEVLPSAEEELSVRMTNEGAVYSGPLGLNVVGSHRFSVQPRLMDSLAPGESATLLVRFEAPAGFGVEEGELQVVSHRSQTVARVPLVGTVEGTELVIEGPYGEIAAPVGWEGGAPYAWRIEVRNIGTKGGVKLTTELQGPGASAFELIPLDDGMAIPGRPEPYELRFEPKRVGSHEATLFVRGDGQQRSIRLEGWANLPIAACDAIPPVVQVGRPIDIYGWDDSHVGDADCAWIVRQAPPGSTRQPVLPTSCSTTFTPDLVGDYVLELELTDAAGNVESCSRSFEAYPFQALWVELYWDRPSDVDLFVMNLAQGNPQVQAHWYSTASCFYANCRANMTPLEWGPAPGNRPILDVDDLSGTGPENITVDDVPHEAGYAIGVHWFDRKQNATTRATVNVFCDGGLAGTVSVELDANKVFFRLGDVRFSDDGCAVEFDPVRWAGFGPANP